MHITPGPYFRQTVDIVICYIHASRISYFPINDSYFPMVAVGSVVDIRECERIELYNFNALFTYFLEMFLFQRFVVRPVAKSIEHSTYLNPLFHFLSQQVE